MALTIIIDEVTILTMEKFISMMIKTNPHSEKKLVSDGFLGLFPKYEVKQTKSYALEISYIRESHKMIYTCKSHKMIYTCESNDYNSLRKQAKSVVAQLKDQNFLFINQAFEETFLKGLS